MRRVGRATSAALFYPGESGATLAAGEAGPSEPRPVVTSSSAAELGLTALREVAQRIWGAEDLPWYVSYCVRVGVK